MANSMDQDQTAPTILLRLAHKGLTESSKSGVISAFIGLIGMC